MPKVSVIVPVYGVEQYIERCARSLFEQTLEDIEFIFVDDCTPDKSIEILKNVLEDYPLRKDQVKIVSHEKNMGLPIARQSGLKVASGDYVIHCDSDDWVDVTMYEKMYNKAIEEDADMVVCDYIVTDGESTQNIVKACHSVKPFEFLENMLFQRDPWSHCNKLFKKTAYYNVTFPTGAMGEDMAITLQLLWNCNYLSYINEPLYYYYYNFNSITKKVSIESCEKRFNQIKGNTDIVLDLFENKTLSPLMKEGLVNIQYLAKRALLPIVWQRKYYHMWVDTYRGLVFKVIKSNCISLKDKIEYILTFLHLYPRRKNRATF